MRPARVGDIEREVYPLNQVHIAADGIDIVEEFWVLRGTPWAIAVGKDLARRTPGVSAMADHPKQQLGCGRRALASRTNPEVIFLLKSAPAVRAEYRRVPRKLKGLM